MSLRCLLVGDSITVGAAQNGGWRPILQGLFESVGQPVTFSMLAAGGWSTAEAWPSFPAALLQTQPDLVLIGLGTNDTGDLPGFELRFDRMIGAVMDMTSAKLGAAFIQYSALNYPTLANGEAAVNDAIYRRLQAHGFLASPAPARFAGLADYQNISGAYLDPGGVHPTGPGYELCAHKLYDAVHDAFGLPAIPFTYPALTGHRP